MSRHSVFATEDSLSSSRRARTRRATVMGMMAVLLPVLAILAAVSVNLAHIQVTRTELLVATDASARAGSRAFSETQTVSAAKMVAANVAAMNMVDDQPLLLDLSDGAGEVQFGITTQPNGVNGRYVFQQVPTGAVESGLETASAFRVLGRRESDSLSGKVSLAIPGVLQQHDFASTQEAVAMQVDRDIALVIDRSGSMEFLNLNWPSGISPFSNAALNAGVAAGLLRQDWRGYYFYANGINSSSYQQWAWQDFYELGPTPSSPWQDLLTAVDAFLGVLDMTVQEEQVSVASYATNASLDTPLATDYNLIRDTIHSLDVIGATAIGRGMQEGIKALRGAGARPQASKTMVVMTDGVHNRGIRPDAVARTLVSQNNLTIHTVTFGDGADQQLMRNVATIGGGSHYHADSGAELVAIFEEIANNLPTILTK